MKHPPYHLRINKAVDRFILIDLIRKLYEINGKFYKSKMTYCSLGGPFLEDLKLIYDFFPDMEIVSLEEDENTYKRQELHKFASMITLKLLSMSEYLDQVDPSGKEIFWLDYEELKLPCFNDFGRVLERVNEGSIVKITVPCDLKKTPFSSNLQEDLMDVSPTGEQVEYVEKFRKTFGGLFDSSINHRNFYPPMNFLKLVQSMIRIQSVKSLSAAKNNSRFQILSSNYYNDNTQMLSISGIVVDESDITPIKDHYSSWEFQNLEWEPPQQIKIPILSIKERLQLEKYLPTPSSKKNSMTELLGYLIEDDPVESEAVLKQYEKFCRYYPVFVKVVS